MNSRVNVATEKPGKIPQQRVTSQRRTRRDLLQTREPAEKRLPRTDEANGTDYPRRRHSSNSSKGILHGKAPRYSTQSVTEHRQYQEKRGQQT